MTGQIALIPDDTSTELTFNPGHINTIFTQLDITRHCATKHQKAVSTTSNHFLPET